jgi:hypothetical protein
MLADIDALLHCSGTAHPVPDLFGLSFEQVRELASDQP